MLTAGARVKLDRTGRANGSHVAEDETITEDALLGGRLRIRQPKRGYRVNVDTLLLAASVGAESGARLMEAGCGVGAALIAVAARCPGAALLGVERDANMAALARENVALNAMQERVEIVTGDALERSANWGANWGVFDGVFFNPPYDEPGEGRAPAASRAYAHIADAPIDAWVAALADRLTGGAALTLIHRAAKTGEVLAAFEGRLGGAELIPIHPRAGEPAKRVLVRARKGSRAPLTLLPGLTLHDASGAKYTPETEALLRGEGEVVWGGA
jgi:tRNA1(Val) A37 N6-methylase TrmN6